MRSSDPEKDVERLKAEYADRATRLEGSNLYSLDNPANMFIHLQRQQETIRMLSGAGLFPLSGKNILEVGCGDGGVLREYLYYGGDVQYVFGVELLAERARRAQAGLRRGIILGDGQHLPVRDCSQDLVMQYTMFTSILSDQIKQNIATEMLRVLKPNGAILWYDFWLNPTNAQTKGIRKGEVKELFPNCSFAFTKITLAPPLARRIVPISWIFGSILEKLKIFNSHYLVLIRPESGLA